MAARLQEWHEANNDLWSELIEALEGESMTTLARKIETGDGKAVWDAQQVQLLRAGWGEPACL